MVESGSVYYKLYSLPKAAILEKLQNRLGEAKLLEILSSSLEEEIAVQELHGNRVSKELLIDSPYAEMS